MGSAVLSLFYTYISRSAIATVIFLALTGCHHRVLRITKVAGVYPNGRVLLETTTCQLISEIPVDYITNIVSRGDNSFVAVTASQGSSLLYQIASHAGANKCFLLPQQPARLVQQLNSSLTLINRVGGEGVISFNPSAQVTYLVSPFQMKQSLLHDAPAQFVLEADSQIFVIDGPLQPQIEASSISYPIWRGVTPVLDSTCTIPLSAFKQDTVFYDPRKHEIMALFQCGNHRVLAASQDVSAWQTVVSFDHLIPSDAEDMTAHLTDEGSLLLKWREPAGNWLAVVVDQSERPVHVISGTQTRDLIDVWHGTPISVVLDRGVISLWVYDQASQTFSQIGTSGGQNCTSLRVSSGSPKHITAICWVLRPNGEGTRRAEGLTTEDGGATWSAF